MTDLAELLERVKAATGPDREIDDLIAVRVAGMKPTTTYGHEILGNVREAPNHSPRYTASLDAALALVERALPRWEFTIAVEHPGEAEPAIWRCSMGDPLMGFDTEAPSAALALLAAALEALSYMPAAPADVGNSQLTRDK